MQSLTHHARARMQQRGIRPEAIEALLDFGCARHLHSKGRELVFFDKKGTGAPRESQPRRRARSRPPSAHLRDLGVGRHRHHRRPPLPPRDARLAMELPLDFLVAISPFIVLFVLWVLEDW